ncbi:MAG: bifunctional oligoribonuclease/PAP phosphatase NrnA [Sphaerochaetaceae bacterium]|nr:bifunctional oligoribonuclease/PAP phosphatase NrnA [Spirochaetales bacterium]MDY5499971.1 bifunctional oligoribonuclease/PAP phosphatase NrnA [Sphaerochaetaceae bacterium]
MSLFPPIPQGVLTHLKEDSSFIVIGHKSPDGDCISSELGMEFLLKALGKQVLLANAGPFERQEIQSLRSRFVDHIPDAYLAGKPTVVIVDCSTSDRIGSLYEQVKELRVLVIDHHASGTRWGQELYIVPDSPSTTLLVQHLFETLQVEIPETAAKELFFGFATDTGFFRFLQPNQAEALDSVSRLVAKGASPNQVYMQINGGKSLSFIKYLGVLIDRAESYLDGKVMVTYTWLKDKEKFLCDKPSDLFYGQMLSIAGVQAVALFKEKEDGTIEAGLRASHNSAIDVGQIATFFGGGGHVHASGFTVKGDLFTTRDNFLRQVELFLKN